MKQRDKAETKTNNKHGGAWGGSDEQRKAHQSVAKHAKRARRRLDKEITKEEMSQ